MDALVIVIVLFLLGFFCGRKYKRKPTVESRHVPVTQKSTPKTPYRKFRHSRWEDRDELFWNMLREGVCLHRKRSGYLLSEVENRYRDNLNAWFGHYCYINSQVSLGQLIDFPEQSQFSEEERKRFFAIFNAMAMDFVLVSKKTQKIVCVIELNDASHLEPERVERDKKLAALMHICKIPFIAVDIKHLGSEPDIWSVREKTLGYAS